MAKNRKPLEIEEQAQAEAVVVAPPAPAPIPVVLSLEQVALSQKMEPLYKSQHLQSIKAFCRSSGLPESGTLKEMLEVLRKYGYKI